MSSIVRRFTLTAAIAVSMCGFNIAAAAAAPTGSSGGSCVDHSDNGAGNFGDPGDGGNHHNEDVGIGNGADPGNGQGHFCNDV